MESIYIIDVLLQNEMPKYLKREGVDFRTTKFTKNNNALY